MDQYVLFHLLILTEVSCKGAGWCKTLKNKCKNSSPAFLNDLQPSCTEKAINLKVLTPVRPTQYAFISIFLVKIVCAIVVLLREKLKQLIEKRIGKENFVEKLGFITKHELYSRAAQKPQPVFPSPEQMLFDHEFTKLVKELEGQSEEAPNTP